MLESNFLEQDIEGCPGLKYKDVANLIGQYETLNLKGGGAKGFLEIKALDVIIKSGIADSIKTIRGSSVGGIFAAMGGLAVPAEDTLKVILENGTDALMDREGGIFRKAYKLFTTGGIFSGYRIEDTISHIIDSRCKQISDELTKQLEGVEVNDLSEEEKEICEIAGFSEKELKGTITIHNFSKLLKDPDLNLGRLHKLRVLEDIFLNRKILQYPRYFRDIETTAAGVRSKDGVVISYKQCPNVSVAYAGLASATFPLFFQVPSITEKRRNKYQKEYLEVLDGGLFTNNPNALDEDDRSLTLAISTNKDGNRILGKQRMRELDGIYKKKEEKVSLIWKIINFILEPLLALKRKLDWYINFFWASQAVRDYNNPNTLYFPDAGLTTAGFALPSEEVEQIMDRGYEGFVPQLKNLNKHIHRINAINKKEKFDLDKVSNLVLSGDPASIAGTVGELDVLFEKGVFTKNQVKRVSGCSAAAIVSLMVSLGADSEYIKQKVLVDKIFEDPKFFKDTKYRKAVLEGIFKELGIDPDITFGEFNDQYPDNPQCYFFGYKAAKYRLAVFSHETRPDMSLLEGALVASFRLKDNDEKGIKVMSSKGKEQTYYGQSYDDISIAAIFKNQNMINQKLELGALKPMGQTLHLASVCPAEDNSKNTKSIGLKSVITTMFGVTATAINRYSLKETNNVVVEQKTDMSPNDRFEDGRNKTMKALEKPSTMVNDSVIQNNENRRAL